MTSEYNARFHVQGCRVLQLDDFEPDGDMAANGLYALQPGSVRHYFVRTPKDTDNLVQDKCRLFQEMCGRQWDRAFDASHTEQQEFKRLLVEDLQAMAHTRTPIHLVVTAPVGQLLTYAVDAARLVSTNITLWLYSGEYNCAARENPLLQQLPHLATQCTLVDCNRFKALSAAGVQAEKSSGSSATALNIEQVLTVWPALRMPLNKYCLRFNVAINCRPSKFIANFDRLTPDEAKRVTEAYQLVEEKGVYMAAAYFAVCTAVCRAYWPQEMLGAPRSTWTHKQTWERAQQLLEASANDGGTPVPYLKGKKAGVLRPGAVDYEFPLADCMVPLLMWWLQHEPRDARTLGEGGWGFDKRGRTNTEFKVDAQHPVAYQPRLLPADASTVRPVFDYFCTLFLFRPSYAPKFCRRLRQLHAATKLPLTALPGCLLYMH